jgi:endo-1,4-beta-D-glucanase Y
VKITKILALVLRRFCYYDGEWYLWADAVSINQADLDEKGIQVAMMGDVYRKALRVLAWLSQGDKESAQAMSSIEEIAKASDTYGTESLKNIVVQGA